MFGGVPNGGLFHFFCWLGVQRTPAHVLRAPTSGGQIGPQKEQVASSRPL